MTYPGADINIDEIRLLHLHPGSDRDALEAHLEAFKSSDAAYEALSYTWGGSAENRHITVNARHFTVTDNLWHALHRLRHRHGERVLWIDAICINQQDLQDREHQVSHMYDIYCRASRVLIWLGESEMPSSINDSSRLSPNTASAGGEHKFFYDKGEPSQSKAPAYSALDRVLGTSKPLWFERAWTVQEALANPKFLICFGPYLLSWDDRVPFTGLVKWIDDFQFARYRDSPILDPQRMRLLEQVQHLRYLALVRSKNDGRFFVLADIIKRRSCMDPRDKIYSLLGLLNARAAAAIPPDYSITTQELYARATFEIMAAESSLELLRFVTFSESSVMHLPSWTVDFTSPKVPRTPLGQHANLSSRRGLLPLSLSNDSLKLTITGIFLDVVETTIALPNDIIKFTQTPPSTALLDLLSLALDRIPGPFLLSASDIVEKDTSNDMLPESLGKFNLSTTSMYDCIIDGLRIWSGKAKIPGDQLTMIPDLVGWPSEPFKDMQWYTQDLSGSTILFSTHIGFLGLGPANTQKGDTITLMPGGKRPILLRRYTDDFTLCGFCYVHGTVDPAAPGDILDSWFTADLPLQSFSIA